MITKYPEIIIFSLVSYLFDVYCYLYENYTHVLRLLLKTMGVHLQTHFPMYLVWNKQYINSRIFNQGEYNSY
jgi:hypothetical protein